MPVITLRGVSKVYRFGPPLELRRLLHRALAARPAAPGDGERPRLRYALRDLDLEVEPGESFGVIGRNGAGKTTLLRLLAGVTLPTRGRVRVEGRVASFIGLGMGFHPELTGRENVHLYCALMGLDRPAIRARVEEIVSRVAVILPVACRGSTTASRKTDPAGGCPVLIPHKTAATRQDAAAATRKRQYLR